MEKKELSKEDIRDKYNSFASRYNIIEIFSNFFIGKYRKDLLKYAYGNVLEVGIGTGANLRYYDSNCKIIGIDLSREMLKKAERKAKTLRKEIILKEGDAEKLHFKREKFDTVVDTLGLCTYPNPIRALKEMKRVCKKNGKILLLEHGISNKAFIAKLQRKREHKHYQKIGCSLLRNPEELVRKAGLNINKIERKVLGIIYVIVAMPS